MNQSLFDEDEDLDELLSGIQCVMRHLIKDQTWAARAVGQKDYAYGRTAAEAIANAKAMTKPRALTRTKLL